MRETRASRQRLRLATAADAKALAELHAESWRRHYRGAYSDAFLDGEVAVDRLAVWSERLRDPDPRRCTIVAEADRIVGFANTIFEDDPAWRALLDNLHVADGQQRRGIGSRLVAMTARAVDGASGRKRPVRLGPRAKRRRAGLLSGAGRHAARSCAGFASRRDSEPADRLAGEAALRLGGAAADATG